LAAFQFNTTFSIYQLYSALNVKRDLQQKSQKSPSLQKGKTHLPYLKKWTGWSRLTMLLADIESASIIPPIIFILIEKNNLRVNREKEESIICSHGQLFLYILLQALLTKNSVVVIFFGLKLW
jgi:hypothetical protein